MNPRPEDRLYDILQNPTRRVLVDIVPPVRIDGDTIYVKVPGVGTTEVYASELKQEKIVHRRVSDQDLFLEPTTSPRHYLPLFNIYEAK